MKKLCRIFRDFIQSAIFIRRFLDYIEYLCNRGYCIESTIQQEGWSFVIITNGKNLDMLNSSLNSILGEFDDDGYEIIVVGQNRRYPKLHRKIRYISYYSLPFLTGWITAKKNIGAKAAIYDKLVIMHDYVSLKKGWKLGFDVFNNEYDICLNRITLRNGNRTRDWVVYDYPNLGAALLPYMAQCQKYQYINGTYFAVKKSFFLDNLLNENLRWGEGEDVEWSNRIREKADIVFNSNSSVSYLKEKSLSEAPYCNNWIDNTIKLYKIYGININRADYVDEIGKY